MRDYRKINEWSRKGTGARKVMQDDTMMVWSLSSYDDTTGVLTRLGYEVWMGEDRLHFKDRDELDEFLLYLKQMKSVGAIDSYIRSGGSPDTLTRALGTWCIYRKFLHEARDADKVRRSYLSLFDSLPQEQADLLRNIVEVQFREVIF